MLTFWFITSFMGTVAKFSRAVLCIINALQGRRCKLGKLHREAAGAQVTSELLAKQRFDIPLIVDH